MCKKDIKLKDYYEEYIPIVHPDLVRLCSKKNDDTVSLNFADIGDYLKAHHGNVTICDVFLLTNKNLFSNSTLEREIGDLDGSLKTLICENSIWISTANKIENYYTNPKYSGMPFSDRPINFEGLYGQYLVDKYGQIFYYSRFDAPEPPESYKDPIFKGDIVSAVRYCVGLELDKLIEKFVAFMNRND